jgi:hypothetical protein
MLSAMPNHSKLAAGVSAAANHVLSSPADEARRLMPLLVAHGEVTLHALAEALFAGAFGGVPMKRGNKDFDIQCSRFGAVEVRSRVVGTDGDTPRLTLRRSPSGYDHVCALRFERDFSVVRAVVLPTAALVPLHAAYKQKKKDIAHIPWTKIEIDPAVIDVTEELIAVLKG